MPGTIKPGNRDFTDSSGFAHLHDGTRNFSETTVSVGPLIRKGFYETSIQGITAQVIGKYEDGTNRILFQIDPSLPMDDRIEAYVLHNEKVLTNADLAEHQGKGQKEKK